MRPLRSALVLSLALVAPVARAQLSNTAISVESGISAPLGEGGGAGMAIAVSASTWLGGDVEGFARVGRAYAPGTAGRAADAALAGTLGLRLSLGPAPIRLQLLADVGWARAGSAEPRDRFAFGLAGGLELFPARDLSVAVRAGPRGVGGALRLEAALAVAAYF